MWAFIAIILGFVNASSIWDKVDSRLAEAAADSIGLDTAISWNAAVKTSALLMIMTLGTVITAYALACTSEKLISYFAYYDDKTE